MRDFDSVIVNFLREQGIPGASLCVAKGGHVIYTQSKDFRLEFYRIGKCGAMESLLSFDIVYFFLKFLKTLHVSQAYTVENSVSLCKMID